MKFKVGDNVKVVESGYSYTTYDMMFRRLNFRNPNENPIAPKGTVGTVFGVCTHTSSNIYICVAIRDKFGTEYLIEQKGLMLVEDKGVGTTTTKVTRKQLGEIYPLVCEGWQSRINEVLSQNPFIDTMNVDNKLLLKAYANADNVHHTRWLDEVTGGINSLKPQIELNKWYWVKARGWNKQDALIYVQDLSTDCKGNYGFNHAGEWLNGVLDKWDEGSYHIYNNLDRLRPATDTEVFEALKKEAIRRGLIEGVIIKALWIGTANYESTHSLSVNYIFDEHTIKNMSVCTYGLMRGGIWATPIAEPKFIWLKTKCKGKIVIEQHPENKFENLLLNGWEKLTQSDLEQIKNEI